MKRDSANGDHSEDILKWNDRYVYQDRDGNMVGTVYFEQGDFRAVVVVDYKVIRVGPPFPSYTHAKKYLEEGLS